MAKSIYSTTKALAYSVLASIASCDHLSAKSKGFENGWQMLLDKHDDPEMSAFCVHLSSVLSPEQSKVLLDGLAREYCGFENWLYFTAACFENPFWKPSQETIAQHISRVNLDAPKNLCKATKDIHVAIEKNVKAEPEAAVLGE